jgi:hypothetical protein
MKPVDKPPSSGILLSIGPFMVSTGNFEQQQHTVEHWATLKNATYLTVDYHISTAGLSAQPAFVS